MFLSSELALIRGPRHLGSGSWTLGASWTALQAGSLALLVLAFGTGAAAELETGLGGGWMRCLAGFGKQKSVKSED